MIFMLLTCISMTVILWLTVEDVLDKVFCFVNTSEDWDHMTAHQCSSDIANVKFYYKAGIHAAGIALLSADM